MDYTWQFTVEFAEDLAPGWNLISIPTEIHNTSRASVLQSIEGDYNRLLAYDASDLSSPWKSWSANKPDHMNSLVEITNEMGLWVHVNNTNGTTLSHGGIEPGITKIHMENGWNLVSYPTTMRMPISDALAGIPYTEVRAQEPSGLGLASLDPGDLMEPGKGYWIYCENECDWIVYW